MSEIVLMPEVDAPAPRPERREVLVCVGERHVLDVMNMGADLPRFVSVPEFPALPAGYRIRAVTHDFYRRCFVFAVEHPSFAPVPDGCAAPYWHEVIDLKWRAVEVKRASE